MSLIRNVLFVVLIFTESYCSGQYADVGSGKLKNQIWWFDWNSFSFKEGASRSFTTADGLTVKITFSNVSGQTLYPNVMNTWPGAVLHYLYDFSNQSIQPALYFLNTQSGFTTQFSLNITATRNGIAVPFAFVTADAEASNANEEFTTITTDGGSWNTVDFFRNSTQTSNPLTGCGTKKVIISDTYGGAAGIGQNPVLATDAPASGTLNVGLTLSEQAVNGGMGMAFGIFAPVDRGDLPASYGYAYHELKYDAANSCNYNSPFPTLVQNTGIKLGDIAGDADITDGTDDNLSGVADEDAIRSFPLYDGKGTYSLSLKVGNTSGAPVYLTGWFDYNNDGKFEDNEMSQVTVPDNAVDAVVKWTALPSVISSSDIGFRFRISSEQNAVQSATGFAPDGEVEDYQAQIVTGGTACQNNWLYNTAQNSGVKIGNLDVSGDQMTIEATINRTTNYTGGPSYAGNIVSKHNSPDDVNYLLRPNNALITTTNGFFATPEICDIQLNKSYHIAMVYDGKQLKFYRNGFLMSQVNCTGNLFQNDYTTIIGENANYPTVTPETFIGYINEVRIWNVARTQDQIKAYMNTTLPNPSLQQGLLAYYTFDGLKNKQGNSAWDGRLFGSTAIQNANPACSSFIADSCSVIINPVLNKSNDTSLCLGQSAQIKVNAINSIDYSWSPVLGLSDPGIPDPVATPNSSTVYYITVHVNGAGGTVVTLFDSVRINVLPLPSIRVPDDTAICRGSALQINATGAQNYSWYPSSGLSANSIPNPVASPLIDTKYFVTGTDAAGCSSKDSIIINIKPLPVITKNNDTIVCIGNPVNLLASGGISYQWRPATGLSDDQVNNPVALPNVTTSYVVTVTGVNACMASDSILITVLAKPVFVINPQSYSLCLGDSVVLTASGGDNYEWLSTSGIQDIYSPVITAKPSVTTTYPVKIFQKTCNFLDTLNATVTVNPLPDVSITKSNDIDCSVGVSSLSASGGVKYNWSPVTGLSDPVISNPKVQIAQTTKYTVAVTSSNGCISSDTITVNVFNHSGNLYSIASAFTPNGDGLNDCFGIKGWGVITSFDFSVYNRWGERIFFSTDPSKCWDGYYKSYLQPSGTYIYYVKAKTLCGDVEKKGTVILIR